ncbi:histidine kinase [Tomitella gaofuii]|uniref:sensor histidine kinase n=1 Tax=Tomitella gaofuii TaxID=2760083 RepID=UPI0015F9676C|nr:histidine kinase [Tomitella gaofuii]
MTVSARAGRSAAVIAIAVFTVAGGFMSPHSAVVVWACAAIAVGVSTALAALRVRGLALAVGFVLVAAALTIAAYGFSATIAWMGFCVIAIWIAIDSPLRISACLGAGLIVTLLVQLLRDPAEPGWIAWVVGTAFSFTAGASARRLHASASRLQEALESLRSAQSELAQRSREQERARIAADVHDVIGHGLTVTLLHIEAARLTLDEGPEIAGRSLLEAEQLTRTSLEEVRATVGLMKQDDPRTSAPLPGAGDIADLVDSFRTAGVRVDLAVTDDLDRIGAARGLTTYRIVQEALTNAARHAPGHPISGRVLVEDGEIRVTVCNTCDPAAEPQHRDGAGEGLRNMHERARSVGGRLIARGCQGAWSVEAVLPL